MKNMNNFHFKGKPSCATDTFHFQQRRMDTKEKIGKSMKNALDILWYAKRNVSAEVTSNSEKIKPVALDIIELRLSEVISQENSI